jgi:hypothetical protein
MTGEQLVGKHVKRKIRDLIRGTEAELTWGI